MPITITISDLEMAYEWSSSGGEGENLAYISKETGKIYYLSEYNDTEDEVPDDIEEPDRYWVVPHQHELDLGQRLVMDFVSKHLPDEYNTVRSFFQRRGAYAQYKNFLTRHGKLEQWHQFENQRTQEALLEWAKDEGLTVAE